VNVAVSRSTLSPITKEHIIMSYNEALFLGALMVVILLLWVTWVAWSFRD
jgi:hypothetical protein